MAQHVIKLTGPELTNYLRRLGSGRYQQAALRGARRAGLHAVARLQQATSVATPASANGSTGAVNTGMFKRSWKTEPVPDGAIVFNDRPYAGVIEYGRRAGAAFPPLRAIEQWAIRKLGLSPQEAKRAAYPIAKAIAKRGLRARRVMRGTLPDIEKDFLKDMVAEMERELNKP